MIHYLRLTVGYKSPPIYAKYSLEEEKLQLTFKDHIKLLGRCAIITFRFPAAGGGRSSPDERTSDSSVCCRVKFGDDRFCLPLDSPFPIIEIGSKLRPSK